MIHVLQCRFARSVCFHISHVADVSLGRVGSGMRFLGWIKMSAGGTSVCCAAIAEFMHVKPMVASS